MNHFWGVGRGEGSGSEKGHSVLYVQLLLHQIAGCHKIRSLVF